MKKKYDVFGIGNALVDIVTEVDEDFLKKFEVEKGLMTLVDEERQQQLMSGIHLPGSIMKCGGSAANTIISVSQFGGKSFYSCKVAKDELGAFYLKDLGENMVDTNLTFDKAKEGITGRCLVMTTPDAERTMNTFLGITADFSVDEIDVEALKASTWLYIEGYLVTSEQGREAMKTAKKIAEANGVKTALTFSDPSMVKYFRKEMVEVIDGSIDFIFCNESEAMLYTETNDLAGAFAGLKNTAAEFVITRSAKGAMVYDGHSTIEIAPFPVNAIDANGAGDLFAGAFLYGITNGLSYADAGRLASRASSKVVAQFGPRLTEEEAKAVYRELF